MVAVPCWGPCGSGGAPVADAPGRGAVTSQQCVAMQVWEVEAPAVAGRGVGRGGEGGGAPRGAPACARTQLDCRRRARTGASRVVCAPRRKHAPRTLPVRIVCSYACRKALCGAGHAPQRWACRGMGTVLRLPCPLPRPPSPSLPPSQPRAPLWWWRAHTCLHRPVRCGMSCFCACVRALPSALCMGEALPCPPVFPREVFEPWPQHVHSSSAAAPLPPPIPSFPV
jgi:hypothetical protein